MKPTLLKGIHSLISRVRRDMIVEAAGVVDDAVVEVPASLVAERVRKERKRVPWTEERLLCLLQTANSFRYSTIRFKGGNLTYVLR